MKQGIRLWQSLRWPVRLGMAFVLVLATALGARAIITNLVLVRALHDPQAQHVDQEALLTLVQNNQTEQAFENAFEGGDQLFSTVFNALDGVGANVGNGQRFTHVPRADLNGPGQWANHTPSRATGPNAQSCTSCHNTPNDDGSGSADTNVHRDPLHSGILSKFIERNTPHTFGAGAVQRLAEEMTTQLQGIRDATIRAACASQFSNGRTAELQTKGVNFGSVRVTLVSRGGTACPNNGFKRFAVDLSGAQGIDTDLVVKPFQWKGSVAFLRDFNRGAAHNELGMQAVELVGDGVDGDFDGVVNELSVGDMTALAVYMGGQPRPVTRTELASLGLIPALAPQELTSITNGGERFHDVGCDSCHKPSLTLDEAMFSEPSQNPNYRDATFPAGQNPVARGVDPTLPITFDLTQDILENQIDVGGGHVVHLGNHVSNGKGGAIISLFGDLKRHYMGQGLAEGIDEVGTGPATFLTRNLWGIGTTAPYLHDGRATTLTEAILEHGGEASQSRSEFVSLSNNDQSDLIAYLNNLVLYKPN